MKVYTNLPYLNKKLFWNKSPRVEINCRKDSWKIINYMEIKLEDTEQSMNQRRLKQEKLNDMLRQIKMVI